MKKPIQLNGITSGMAQKVNPTIAKKIEKFLKEGMTDPIEIQQVLRSLLSHVCLKMHHTH